MLSVCSLGFLLSSACNSSSNERAQTTDLQIDLPAYFQNEVKTLNNQNPLIVKTVKKDSVSETQELNIADWEKELSNFLAIDLNKAVYHGAYQKDSTEKTVTYTFNDPNVDLSTVKIVYDDQNAAHITIKRITKNLLYNTEENLVYNKGKSYSVEKVQKVKLLGAQHYHIEGIIK